MKKQKIRKLQVAHKLFGLIFMLMWAGVAHANPLDVLDFIMGVPELLMKLVTALFIVLAAILYVGQYIYTQILVKIAILMMPIMVPFIMLEKTRFLFEGWLKFLITAGMTKIVGAIMFGLLHSNVKTAADIAEKTAQQSDAAIVSFEVYSALLLLTGLTAYMMTQTQQIGNSLVSGFVQGGFKFSPVGQAAAMTKGMPSGAANAANKGTGAAVGAATGVHKAISGQTQSRPSSGHESIMNTSAKGSFAHSAMTAVSQGVKGAAEGAKTGITGMVSQKLGGGAKGDATTGGGATATNGTKAPVQAKPQSNSSRNMDQLTNSVNGNRDPIMNR